jgi:branched-chain amino acid aminotransferase
MIHSLAPEHPLHVFDVEQTAAPTPSEQLSAILKQPGFGQFFTDHMIDVSWSRDKGWHTPRVRPFGPVALSPAAGVLHYAQEIFEGLKAYRHADGSIWTFRAEANAERFQRSAQRMVLPELPTEIFLEALRALISVDGDWVPSGDEMSLYLRPFMYASEAFLGIRAANEVTFSVIASPAGVYFSGEVAPVSIWLSTDHARAAKGGTGAAKTGGNYASSLLPQREGAEHGCAQVLFLDSATGQYIEELGGMNVVLVKRDGTLVTPESKSILDGITLDSVLTLASDRGHKIERRPVTITEWREGVDSGDVAEVFACGTAAVITPIGALKGHGFSTGDETAPAGELTMSLRAELTNIQYGRRADDNGWLTRLDV